MKRLIQLTGTLLTIYLAGVLFLQSCTPKEDEDPNPNNPSGTAVDPDNVTQSLKFKNGIIVSGTLSPITQTADLQVDSDTIFWTKGVTKRIKIRRPASVSIGSLSIQVKNSKTYINVPIEKLEETDSVSVFYFDFDPDKWQLPITFEIKIVARNQDGTALDEFDLPVVIENDKSAACSFQENKIWKWIYTTSSYFQSSPLAPQVANGTIAGCCDSEGNSFYASCFNTPAHREVDYLSYVVVELDYLKFFDSGDVGGQLIETTRNIQPALTDFCGGTPGYKTTTISNAYNGKYTINSGNCTIKIDQLEGLTEPVFSSDGIKIGDYILPIYAGFGTNTEYKIISKHFIKESRSGEGGSITRFYELQQDGAKPWYD